jgi:hypothetical protein
MRNSLFTFLFLSRPSFVVSVTSAAVDGASVKRDDCKSTRRSNPIHCVCPTGVIMSCCCVRREHKRPRLTDGVHRYRTTPRANSSSAGPMCLLFASRRTAAVLDLTDRSRRHCTTRVSINVTVGLKSTSLNCTTTAYRRTTNNEQQCEQLLVASTQDSRLARLAGRCARTRRVAHRTGDRSVSERVQSAMNEINDERLLISCRLFAAPVSTIVRRRSDRMSSDQWARHVRAHARLRLVGKTSTVETTRCLVLIGRRVTHSCAPSAVRSFVFCV